MGNLMKMREFRACLDQDLREAERSVYEWGYAPALVAVSHTAGMITRLDEAIAREEQANAEALYWESLEVRP